MGSGSSSRQRSRSSSRVLAGAALLAFVTSQAGFASAARFTAAQGLPPAPVSSIEADDDGRLWVGTAAGLRVLAGNTFVVEAGMTDPGIASPVYREQIRDLAVAPSGEVWVATGGTLHRRAVDGSWHEAVGSAVGLDGGIAAVVAMPDGSVWAGGENAGLARWDGAGWRMVDRTFQVTHLAVGAGGDLWAAGARDGGVLIENPGAASERVSRFGRGELPDASPQALAARGDVVWVGTSDGLIRLAAGTVTRYDRAAGLPSSSILSIAPVGDQEAWIGTTEGLARIDGATVDAALGIAAGLAGRPVHSLALDRAGDLWVGTRTGLVKLATTSWVPPADPVDGFVDAVGLGPGGVGFAVSGGALYLARRDGWSGVSGLGDRLVTTAIVDHAGSILAGTDAGWGVVRDGVFELDARCCTGRIGAILEDVVGRLWIGTDEGLMVVDDVGVVARFRKSGDDTGLGQDPVTAIWPGTAGSVWVATLNGGATPFTDLQPGPRVSLNATGGGLVSDLVTAGLVTQTGELWLGTQAGLSRRVDGAWTTGTGPLGGAITSLAEADGGLVWVGTDASGLALVDCAVRVDEGCALSIFDESDGLAASQITSLAVRDGELWIGTSRGLTRHAVDVGPPTLALGSVETTPSPDGLFFELHRGRLLVDDRPCDASCAAAVLPHSSRAVDVGLIGTDLEDTGGVRFLVDVGTGQPRVADAGEIRQLLAPGTSYAISAIAFDRHFNRSAPVSLALTTGSVPLVQHPLFLAALVALTAVTAWWAWLRWRRRFQLDYRDAVVSLRTTDTVVEARLQSRVGSAPWRPVDLDLAEIEVLHHRFRELDGPDPALLQTLGELLYRPILAGNEDELGLRAGKPVRLALEFEAARMLESLPWELMHGGDELAHLVARGDLALLRRPGTPDGAASGDDAGASVRSLVRAAGLRARPTMVRGRLRVLVAWARPRDREHVAAAEFDAIEKLAGHSGGRMEVIRMPVAQRERLAGALDQDVDVFHFIGHGEMRGGEPVLLFEDEDGWAHATTEAQLADVLGRAETRTRRPRLVVLSACQSAGSAVGQPATGFAGSLVARGVVPAAIGMGYAFPMHAASLFSEALYESLIQHGQIEHAVATARNALRTDYGDRRDWAVPRLYARDLGAATFELMGGPR